MMSESSFTDKVVIVTGAGHGLGRSHALLLASRGATVVVNDLGGAVDGTGGGTSTPANAVVKEIRAQGGRAISDASDISTIEGAQALVTSAIGEFGAVDAVINNAGILRDASLAKMEPKDFDAVVAVHLRGAFAVCQAAWPHMRDRSYGRIVNTSSNAGIFGNFGQAGYGAAKMGLIGLTRVLAQEGERYNILANAIAPIARTRMTEALLGRLAPKLDPALVSPVAAFLASEDCALNGQILSTGGGRVSRLFIGATPGIFDRELSIETVRDNIDAIMSEDGYTVPASTPEETALYVAQLRRTEA